MHAFEEMIRATASEYRKEGRVLVAVEPLRNDPTSEELNFLVRAWKAAFAKAQSLGWLY
jgi:hypothetical protein